MHHHVRTLENLFGTFNDLGPGFLIGVVVEAAAAACSLLYQNGMAVLFYDFHAGRGHGHAIFLCFDFLENSDNHFVLLG